MSLIIEALKRARDDTVRRQAASKGLPLAHVPRLKGRSRWLTLALVPLAAALVVCLLLLFDLYSRLPRDSSTGPVAQAQQTGTETTVELAPAVTTTEVASQQAPTDQGPLEQVPLTGPSEINKNNSIVAEPLAEATTTAGPTEATLGPEVRSPPSISRPVPQSKATSTLGSAREFVGQAQLKDGQLVDLEGIAWSESEPFALLNGQVVGVGEIVRAYRVTEIHQDRVLLQQGEDFILLRLK